MNSPSKGYISQLPVATALGVNDVTIVDQITPSGPITRQAKVSLAFPSILTMNNQVGTSYTLVLTDGVQTFVTMNNASAMTLTIPSNASVAFPIGTNILLMRLGAGTLTVSPAGGVTLVFSSTATLRFQYSVGCIIQIAANSWVLCGDQG